MTMCSSWRKLRDGAARAADRLLVGKLLILRLTTRGLCRPRLRSAGTAAISIRISSVMRRRWRGGPEGQRQQKGGVEGKMTPDHPHGMDEGQRVRGTAALAAGLDHQPTQRQVDEQQGVEFLLGQVGAARAQHELAAGQRDLELGE